MASVQQLAAKCNRDAADSLIRNVRAMPQDKVTWQPLDKGRTALAQLQECAIIGGLTIDTLTSFALPADFEQRFGKEMAEIDTVDKAIARLEENTGKLLPIIQAYPDADLDRTVKMPWLEQPSSMAELMFMNYWNTIYHVGQVCFIQTLYGDGETH